MIAETINCNNCGGSVKQHSDKCEWCSSYIHNSTWIEDSSGHNFSDYYNSSGFNSSGNIHIPMYKGSVIDLDGKK